MTYKKSQVKSKSGGNEASVSEWRERVGFEAAPSLCCSTGSLARAGHLGERDAGAPTDLDRALRSISRFLSLNLPTLSLPDAAGLVPISSSS